MLKRLINLNSGKSNELLFEYYYRDTHLAQILIIIADEGLEHIQCTYNSHGKVRKSGKRTFVSQLREKLSLNKFFTLNDIFRKTPNPLRRLSFYAKLGEQFCIPVERARELVSTGVILPETFNLIEKPDHRIANLLLNGATEKNINCATCLSSHRKIAEEILGINSRFFHDQGLNASYLGGHILQEADVLMLASGENDLYQTLCKLLTDHPHFSQYQDIRILGNRSELCHACKKSTRTRVFGREESFKHATKLHCFQKKACEDSLARIAEEIKIYELRLTEIHGRLAIAYSPQDVSFSSRLHIEMKAKQKEYDMLQLHIQTLSEKIRHFS